jgi:hypothetical protein
MSTDSPSDAAAETIDMGRPRQDYFTGSAQHTRRLYIFAGGFLVTAGLALGLIMISTPANWLYNAAVPAGLSLFFVYFFVTALWKGSQHVQVFDDGFVSRHRGRAFPCRWDHIETVTESITNVYLNGSYSHTAHKLVIQRQDGKQITLDQDIDSIQELAETIQGNAVQHLLPRAAKALNSGKAVGFGPVRLTENGIDNGKDLLAWDEIEGVKLEHGILSIRKKGLQKDWFSRPIAEMPNARVFLGVVDQLLSGE